MCDRPACRLLTVCLLAPAGAANHGGTMSDVPDRAPEPDDNLADLGDAAQGELEQTPWDVLNDDGGLPQWAQDPDMVVVSDEGAEG